MSNSTKKAMRDTDQSTRIAKESVFDKQIQLNNTTNGSDLSTDVPAKILNFIGAGEENAVHLDELMKLTGMGNRELRKCIETLRRSGAVIISNQNGYFQPLRPHEVERYVRQETGRAKSIFHTLKAARKWCETAHGDTSSRDTI